jgi:signal transduction histidine kinase
MIGSGLALFFADETCPKRKKRDLTPMIEAYRRLLRRSGLAVWLAVGLPVVAFAAFFPRNDRELLPTLAWVASWLLFGAAFGLATRRRTGPGSRAESLGLAAGQSAAVLSLAALPPCFGLEGSLLVLVALQLGALLERGAAAAWIALQSAALLGIMWLHWGWHWAVVLAMAYVPFQLIADGATRLLIGEVEARRSEAAARAELAATRELLDQSVRLHERSRIARDLHDLLGHNLAALSINLEIASHFAGGEAAARIETAQSVTKLLLGDVRGAVDALREDGEIDLPAALRKLADGIPRPHIHVDVPPDLAIGDPAAGEVVLRCAQEMVTNALRHAGADNVWIEVERRGESVAIRARDDGAGAASVASGRGLTGMRERLEQRGGTLEVETSPGRGFRLTAALPL